MCNRADSTEWMLSLASMTAKGKLPSLESGKQLEGSLHNMVPSLTSTAPREKSDSLQIGTLEFCLSFVATTWKGIMPFDSSQTRRVQD